MLDASLSLSDLTPRTTGGCLIIGNKSFSTLVNSNGSFVIERPIYYQQFGMLNLKVLLECHTLRYDISLDKPHMCQNI